MLLPRYLLFVVLGCAVGAAPAADDRTDEAEAAQAKVRAFEQPLTKQLGDVSNDRDAWAALLAGMQPKVWQLFAEQTTSVEKIAAMDLLDNRFVYVVTPETASKVVGPLIRDDDPSVRARAAHAIGYNRCGADHAKPLLAMLEGKPPTATLVNVAFAMGRSGHEAFVPSLIGMLDHDSEAVRSKAMFELSVLSSDHAYEHNVKLLKDTAANVRKTAVQLLPQYQSTREKRLRVIELAEDMLGDENAGVRESAIRALGQLESRESVERIKPLLEDDNRNVRRVAGEVIEKLQSN